MSNKDGHPPTYQPPAAAHYDAGPYHGPGSDLSPGQNMYNSPGGPPMQYNQYGALGPPPPQQGGYYGGQPPNMQYGPPMQGQGQGQGPQGGYYQNGPQGGYYQNGPPPQGKQGGTGGGICAGLMGALACCCCLDCLF